MFDNWRCILTKFYTMKMLLRKMNRKKLKKLTVLEKKSFVLSILKSLFP
jgi:hypothetical protein